jgi:hypothetical protein
MAESVGADPIAGSPIPNDATNVPTIVSSSAMPNTCSYRIVQSSSGAIGHTKSIYRNGGTDVPTIVQDVPTSQYAYGSSGRNGDDESNDNAETYESARESTALLSENDIESHAQKEIEFRYGNDYNGLADEKRMGSKVAYMIFGFLAAALVCIVSKDLLGRFILFRWRRGGSLSVGGWTLTRSGYGALDYFTSANVDARKYPLLQRYRAIIEPHAAMELYVEDYKDDDTDYYSLRVCPGANNTESECVVGMYSKSEGIREELVVGCTSFDEYAVTITKHTSDGEIADMDTQLAICVYVRRELRTLTPSDLAATMQAMKVMWEITDEEGARLYGPNFHNATYWTGAHHFNAAWKDADHIHEGLGFLPQHIKISNMFEASMQAVDPSVSLPYWDFTIEAAEGVDLFDSAAFTNETFGSLVAPFNRTVGWTYKDDKIEDARIPDSIFRDITIDRNMRYPENYAGFGYLRAPWNTNPSPYISRFAGLSTPLPACGNHYSMLQYDTLTDFLYNAPYSPHASVHGGAGEIYGCDLFEPMLAAGLLIDFPSMIDMCKKWGFIMKELYRQNFLAQRTDCSYTSLDYDGVDCTMSCVTAKYEYLTTSLEGHLKSKYTGPLTNKQWEEWRDFVCKGDGTRVLLGDHTESASPADPSFWPIHPTLERLYHARMLMGGFSDTRWPTDSTAEYVCDKAECYEQGTIATYAACCYGHYENDKLLDFISGDKNRGTGLTNADILQAASAGSDTYSLPYVYDHFRWDHCSQDFETLFSGTSGTSDTDSTTDDSMTNNVIP